MLRPVMESDLRDRLRVLDGLILSRRLIWLDDGDEWVATGLPRRGHLADSAVRSGRAVTGWYEACLEGGVGCKWVDESERPLVALDDGHRLRDPTVRRGRGGRVGSLLLGGGEAHSVRSVLC